MAPAPPKAPLGRKLAPYAYLSPSLVSIAVLSLFPMAFNVYLAFTNADLYTFKNGVQFNGIANFVEIFTGSFADVFFPVLGWTLIYAAATTLLNT